MNGAPITAENLPLGIARCACGPCFETVEGDPATVLCASCIEHGCEVEGEVCCYEESTGEARPGVDLDIEAES